MLIINLTMCDNWWTDPFFSCQSCGIKSQNSDGWRDNIRNILINYILISYILITNFSDELAIKSVLTTKF